MLAMLLWVYIHTGHAWKICLSTVGIEPTTFEIQAQCSANWATRSLIIYRYTSSFISLSVTFFRRLKSVQTEYARELRALEFLCAEFSLMATFREELGSFVQQFGFIRLNSWFLISLLYTNYNAFRQAHALLLVLKWITRYYIPFSFPSNLTRILKVPCQTST